MNLSALSPSDWVSAIALLTALGSLIVSWRTYRYRRRADEEAREPTFEGGAFQNDKSPNVYSASVVIQNNSPLPARLERMRLVAPRWLRIAEEIIKPDGAGGFDRVPPDSLSDGLSFTLDAEIAPVNTPIVPARSYLPAWDRARHRQHFFLLAPDPSKSKAATVIIELSFAFHGSSVRRRAFRTSFPIKPLKPPGQR